MPGPILILIAFFLIVVYAVALPNGRTPWQDASKMSKSVCKLNAFIQVLLVVWFLLFAFSPTEYNLEVELTSKKIGDIDCVVVGDRVINLNKITGRSFNDGDKVYRRSPKKYYYGLMALDCEDVYLKGN